MKGIWESGPVRFIREMVDIYFGKRVSRSAAELAYFLILTFFPILVCINGFIGILHLDSFAVMAAMEDFLPKEALSVVGEYIGYISTNPVSYTHLTLPTT